ncbi:allophanate hydrolase subunit 1 [Micromonospora sp. NPDC049366]|uniref:allophanate hydrolase subunit 1 n=1 Tax=Micromonospora sp. NPDC049366 TaxID=3364271 RepID=UPI003789C84C
MRIRPVGAHALLLDVAAPPAGAVAAPPAGDVAGPAEQDIAADGDVAGRVEAWRAELTRRRDLGELAAVEIVPAAATVLLDGVPDPETTARRIAGWHPRPVTADTAAAQVEVPVTYDGPDLPLVAEHWATTVATVVQRLTGTEFRVAFCGFAPGFAYLTGLPAELALPRLPTPRPRVPAGSVALAGPYAGIYPSTSPGGWLLVGRTTMALFDVVADPPTRLTPGTRVRLVAS